MEQTFDPYVYEGGTVLKNLIGVKTAKEYEAVEYNFTWPRRQQLEANPVKGDFDLKHLQEIHRRLFQDLFDWAGELRTVTLSKGASTFFAGPNWDTAAKYTFGYLHNGPLLKSNPISDSVFIENAAELLSRINYLHPFREGNGRTQRAFLDQVAGLSGRRLSWRNVGAMENTRASILAHNAGNGKPLEPLIAQVLAPPLDGLSPFDDNVYKVTGSLAHD